MKFIETPLKGAYVIEPNKIGDQRGFFARLFCAEVFNEHGLEHNFVQINNSLSHERGTLRGLHYQLPPKEEVKVVKCVQGSVYDVIVDLRPDSETFGQSFSAHLGGGNGLMMYVPKGFAHGFYVLQPDTEIVYFVSEYYTPELERGVRWDDPYFNIEWPRAPTVLSEKDSQLPDFDEKTHREAYYTLV
ncbi:MAG: dTDP-4-dehydrorhamnose 3,5-epimerase [Chlamydiae bacterium]|nr:dTDP-4-dehydrorhamnose 3,5-epimerase [Chlamydiota bacterium]